ncbi:hypothetical protein QP810_09975 [Streptococcus agalactiae]|uniref:hypothetical protein n=1 Tax=Streptococcus agalactiae TaxID=1311 RepID=UPI0025577A93|nr:hypothetical protein [Streptococcus agalactiae]MDK8747551.1 hypothetical protein [Streptococcus agalactiae]
MGIFTKKSLQDVIDGVISREQKINDRIGEIELKIKKIESVIPLKVKELVGFEISGDIESQNKCKDEIKQGRQQIVELQDLLDAYNSERNSLVFLTTKEISSIKALGTQIIEERQQKAKELSAERESVKQQIESLSKKEKELWTEYQRVRDEKEEVNQVNRVLKYIDKDALKLGNQERFIRNWIQGHDTEQLFRTAQIKRNR